MCKTLLLPESWDTSFATREFETLELVPLHTDILTELPHPNDYTHFIPENNNFTVGIEPQSNYTLKMPPLVYSSEARHKQSTVETKYGYKVSSRTISYYSPPINHSLDLQPVTYSEPAFLCSIAHYELN